MCYIKSQVLAILGIICIVPSCYTQESTGDKQRRSAPRSHAPTASASYCPNDYRENGVYTYDDARDREGVVEIFKNNRSLLTRGGEEHEQQVSSHQFVATYIAGNSTYITKVYRMHGTVVGFISYMQLNAATGHIGGLAVDARYRKRGIARELFRHAVHYFQARRIPEIKIALLKSNTEARKVYERFGFTYQGEMGTMYVYTYRVCTPSLQKKL